MSSGLSTSRSWLIVMGSSNITIAVRGGQAIKPINYSDPALGNSTDCSGVDNYNDNNKDNVKFKDKNKDTDNYNNKGNYKDKDKDKDNANDKDMKNDKKEK